MQAQPSSSQIGRTMYQQPQVSHSVSTYAHQPQYPQAPMPPRPQLPPINSYPPASHRGEMEGVEQTYSQPSLPLPPTANAQTPTHLPPLARTGHPDSSAHRRLLGQLPPPPGQYYDFKAPIYNNEVPQYAQHSQQMAPYSSSSSMTFGPSGALRTMHHERVVGTPGYPEPAKARGPKARFTPEDDYLLKTLKENYNTPKLSWKQIADFFPDRASGTLQVRYCTKLRKKDDLSWTSDMVRRPSPLYAMIRSVMLMVRVIKDNKLRQAVAEVEKDKWRQVSVKLGKTGINAKACEERFETLEAYEAQERGEDDGDNL